MEIVLFSGCNKNNQSDIKGADIKSDVFKVERKSLYTEGIYRY